MDRHITILGILFVCYHVAALFGSVMVLITFLGIGMISSGALRHTLDALPYMPLGILGMVGWLISGLMLLTSLPGLIAGIGLIRFKPWSRMLAMVIAVFTLFSFPIGTALGIYALWILLSNESIELFESTKESAKP